MAEPMTILDADKRITEIDDLVFQGRTGQIPMTIEERARLESEAEYLVQAVHMRLHEDGVVPYQQGYDARQQLRKLTLVSAMAARYTELHPGVNPEADAIVARACNGYSDGSLSDQESAELLGTVFGTIWVDLPNEASTPEKRSFLSRFLKR